MSNTQPINLLDFDRHDLANYFVAMGEKSFRGGQVLQWLHQYGSLDFSVMTNLSKSMRQLLEEQVMVKIPEMALEQISEDGTHKWLLRLDDGNCIETVFIPETGRGTLCVSSQVGCALTCSFCSTAAQGFSRNLTTGEIIGQLWFAVRKLSRQEGQHDRQISNVVMMGMGEPLLNFPNVIKAMNIMTDDLAYGLSKYKVTLSTSGVVPALKELSLVSDVSLAVSLHAANDNLRNELVPINKKYPLRELMAVCKDYYRGDKRRQITMEYVMLDGVNDTPAHAKELVTLLRGIPAKVNLIPFNPFPNTRYRCSKPAVIQAFRQILIKAGLNTIIRKTRGDDIDAACGQLTGKVKDRTKRSQGKRIAIPIEVK